MLIKERVFEEEHFPQRLLHRESEVDQILRAWKPAIHGDRPEDVLIHGPSGVGKTVLSKHCARKLKAQSPVDVVRVRCVGQSTTGILRRVLGELTGQDIPTNTPRADIESQLSEFVSGPVIVILDEADDVPKSEVLDVLPSFGPVGVAAIAHMETEWINNIEDDRTKARFRNDTVSVRKFGVAELADILDSRARTGLAEGVVKRSQLEYIANEVAGNTRHGIQSLREAALEAQEWGAHRIHREHIDIGIEKAMYKIRQGNLDSLPFHHQLLYELIHRDGRCTGQELHDRYDSIKERVYNGVAVTPICKRDRRDKLAKLEDYELIAIDGETRDREYDVLDGRVEASIAFTGLDEVVPPS